MKLHNLLCFVFLALPSLGYFRFIAPHIPTQMAFEVNLVAVPILVGFISFFVFSGKIFNKLGITLLLPIVWEIPLCCEWGKIFLDLLGVITFMIFVFLGFGIAFWIHAKFSKAPIGDT